MPESDESPQWFQNVCGDIAVANHDEDEGDFAASGILDLWDNGANILYSFMKKGTEGAEARQKKVGDVVKEWEQYANVHFKYTTTLANAVVRISFDNDLGSWSYVGKPPSSIENHQPTMNLSQIGPQEEITPLERGTILHEFGHVLGLVHEHHPPTTGQPYALKKEAVFEYYRHLNEDVSEELVENQIVNRYNQNGASNFLEVDPDSLMIYFMPKELNEGSVSVEPKSTLSAKDKAFAQLHYPRFFPEDLQKGYQIFLKALDTLGMQGENRTTMLTHQNSGGVDKIREAYSKICAAGRVGRS